MPELPAVKTFVQPKGVTSSQNPRRRFAPAQRDPLRLPADKIELPSPSQSPAAPPTINLLSSILPPGLMLAGAIIGALINNSSLFVMIPMFLMSLGFPISNLIGLSSQKKVYKKALEKREQTYKQQLNEERKRLAGLISKQRSILEDAYPALHPLERIALSGNKSLWSRLPGDDDFLSLRP